MPVNQNDYVVINIWTAKQNQALRGANCGHISITTPDNYISLWPYGLSEKTYKSTFFGGNFTQRPASYKANYEEDCLYEGLSEHRHEARLLTYGASIKEGEIMYRYNTETHSYEVWSAEIPRFCEAKYRFGAVQLVPANVRMVLYSLDVQKIKDEFERLKTTVTGWSMAGSNALTRNLAAETTENCASLAFRCLNAGGLSAALATRLSTTTSSAVSPDDLLRCAVVFKEKELKMFPETAAFIVVNENGTLLVPTPLEAIVEAFEQVGLHANAEDDFIPNLKPAGLSCAIM